MVTPASSGPKTRARLNWIELSAMAFGRSFLCDERRDHGLVGRSAERLRQPGGERQREDVADVDAALIDERRQRERGGHLDELRADEQPPAIVAIGDDAAEQREEQDRQLPEEVVEPEVERDELVRSRTSQLCATFCVQVPTVEAKAPNQSTRKSR